MFKDLCTQVWIPPGLSSISLKTVCRPLTHISWISYIRTMDFTASAGTQARWTSSRMAVTVYNPAARKNSHSLVKKVCPIYPRNFEAVKRHFTSIVRPPFQNYAVIIVPGNFMPSPWSKNPPFWACSVLRGLTSCPASVTIIPESSWVTAFRTTRK